MPPQIVTYRLEDKKPTSLADFKVVDAGGSKEITVFFKNIGNGDLLDVKVQIQPDEEAPLEAKLLSDPPFRIGVSAIWEARIGWSPTANAKAGERRATLIVTGKYVR